MSDQHSQPVINQVTGAKNVVAAHKIEKVVIEAQRDAAKVPRMAPSVPKLLTGRDNEIQDLVKKFRLKEKKTGSPKIFAIRGMGGIGKTTLATALAHHPVIEQESPDGTLWVSLGPKPDLMTLLDEWGEQFGEDLSGYASPEARSRALASVLHDKKVFIVVDDVWRAEDAGLFAVGGDDCRILLTTRNADVARTIAGKDVYHVKTLDENASIELLEKLTTKAATSSNEDMHSLAAQLGGLPLGLIIAGSLIADEWEAGVGVKGILADLQEKEKRLGMSTETRSVDAALRMSYEWLSDESHKRAFRFLGVFGGKPNTFSLDAAAEVCGLDLPTMRRVMVVLVNRALVEVVKDERYTLHALVADFASILLDGVEDDKAHLNHARHYLNIAKQYTSSNMKNWHSLDPDWNNVRISANWLSTIRGLSDLKDQPKTELMVDLSDALNDLIQARKPLEGLKWLQAGERACDRLDRLETKGRLLLTIGLVELDLGIFDRAIEHFEECERIFNSLGDTEGIIYARGNLGLVYHKRGEYTEAIKIYEQVTRICEDAGDVYGTATGYYNQADVHYLIGNLSLSLSKLDRCSDLCRQEDIRDLLAWALTLYAKIHIRSGNNAIALNYGQEAHLIAEQTGSNILLGLANQVIGEVFASKGMNEDAVKHFEKSILLLSNAKVRDELAEAYVAYGDFLANCGKVENAKGQWLNAIRIFEEIGAVLRSQQLKDKVNPLRN